MVLRIGLIGNEQQGLDELEPTGGGFCNYEAGMGGEENVVGLSNEEVCCVIACHEAGHAAISYSLGLGCSAIVFDAKSNFQAYTRTSKAGRFA